MRTIFDALGFEDEKRARTSLITLSISSLIFQNVKFIENVLNLYFIEVVFDPEQISSLIAWAITNMLLIFVLVSLPIQFSLIKDLSIRKLDRWKRREEISIRLHFGLDDLDDYEEHPQAYFNILERDYSNRQNRIEELFDNFFFSLAILKSVLVSFSVPVGLALLAITGFK